MNPKDYLELARKTSVINWDDEEQRKIAPLGLLGELGSLATIVKRSIRDSFASSRYESHMIEELADLLWYITIIADSRDVFLDSWPMAERPSQRFEQLILLESKVASLLALVADHSVVMPDEINDVIGRVFKELANTADVVNLTLAGVAEASAKKITAHWLPDKSKPAKYFDADYPLYEQLPRKFRVDFREIVHEAEDKPNELIISMNGMHLGDRLTDNNHQVDGYRYHDVFHLAGACCLGWSPVFRSMLKRKRKSDSEIDRVQDGARAIILEEAIVGEIFTFLRGSDFPDGINRVDSDLIKLIQALVEGYEADSLEPWEWQDYIIKAFKLFRQIRHGFSGSIVFDAERREMTIVDSTFQ